METLAQFIERDAFLRPAEAAYRKALIVSRMRAPAAAAPSQAAVVSKSLSIMNVPAYGRSLLWCRSYARRLFMLRLLDFQLQTLPDCQIALLSLAPSTIRSESDRRRFLTVKNESDKIAAAVVFQQTIGSGPGAEIVTIERVSIYHQAPRNETALGQCARCVEPSPGGGERGRGLRQAGTERRRRRIHRRLRVARSAHSEIGDPLSGPRRQSPCISP